MTSKDFITKVMRLKAAYRRGLLTEEEYHYKMTELRAIYQEIIW